MQAVLGTSVPVYIGLVVVLAGGAAFMTGQAIARTWRPLWQVVAYGLLLAIASRFFVYALFDGTMLSATGYLADAVILCGIGLLAFRLNRVAMMVKQYPWLYERAGPFAYRDR
ncbi:MAG: hypothetical protein KDC18_14000 [Alphaproteobacteria bacterium]|nr:hypothetical protein [Alphaproteobacteria bacterium]MCB9928805.1 hypothetical protein [Alphaproteobacteria bacterium]